jgi:hypothetical protein
MAPCLVPGFVSLLRQVQVAVKGARLMRVDVLRPGNTMQLEEAMRYGWFNDCGCERIKHARAKRALWNR